MGAKNKLQKAVPTVPKPFQKSGPGTVWNGTVPVLTVLTC